MDMDIPSLSGTTNPNLLLSGLPSTQTNIVAGGNLDSISTINGVDVLGQFNVSDSILQYVGTDAELLALFNQLIKNIESDNSLNVLKALGALMGDVPSVDQIQQVYNVDSGLLTSGNNDISSLNTYNTGLNSAMDGIQSSGSSIQSDYNNVVSSNVSSTLNAQQSALQTLVTNFEADYPNSMSLTDFQNSLNSIISTSQNASNGEISTYNSAASAYGNYASSVDAYNQSATNPPLSQGQYNSDQQNIATANATNAQLGSFYPTLDSMPDEQVGSNPVNPTQTTISSGAYSDVTFPNSNNYSFTTTSGNTTTVNTTALNQLLSDFGTSVTQGKSVDTGIQSTLGNFINTDYNVQISQLPTTPFPTNIPALTVPTLKDFQNAVLANVVANLATTANSLNNQFSSDVQYAADPSQSPTAQDNQQISNLVQQSNADSNIISLGSVGGVSVLNINGVTNSTSLANAFVTQQQTTNLANLTIPTLSSESQAFIKTISNHLQSVYGAASIFGTIEGFKDASSFVGTNHSLNSSLVALNTLESYQSIIDFNQQGQLNQLASTALPNATPQEVAAQANQAALPYTFASQAQTAVLASQLVQNSAQFSSLYLTSYGASAIDAYIQQKGTLTAAQQQSVITAQATLTNKLVQQNVNFSGLNTNQVAANNAFQSAAQQLQAEGVTLTADQLSGAQAAFLANLQQVPGTLTATQLQQLIISALVTANIQNVPTDVVANAVFLQFVQTTASYIAETQNQFALNGQMNTQQSQQYSDRFSQDLFGENYNNSIQFLLNSDADNDQNFAEEIANQTTNQEENITQSQILEGTPKTVPGTDIMSNAVTAKNDTTFTPQAKRTSFIPV